MRSLTAKSSNEVIEIITTKADEENNDLQLQPELLLSRLTFTHFVELIRVEDDLQRLFYEVETISGMDENMFVSKYLLRLPDKKLLESFMKRELNQ